MKRIFMYFSKAYRNDKISVFAAQASFFIIISAIPYFALAITILGNSSIVNIEKFQNLILSVIPNELYPTVKFILDDVRSSDSFNIISVGAVSALWASCKGIGGVCSGVRHVFGREDDENFIKRSLKKLWQAILFLIVIISSLLIFSFAEAIFSSIYKNSRILSPVIELIFRLRTFIFFVLLCVFFTVLYYLLSGKKGKMFHHITGAFLCSACWISFTFIYSVYIKYSVNKSYLYAGFSAIIFFMLWIYFCMIIILMGAEINKYLFLIDFYKKPDYNNGKETKYNRVAEKVPDKSLCHNSKEVKYMKRMVTIQDISCFGKCSVTVALPIISAIGVECAILPTAVLSTHTGGFTGYTLRDLSDDIPKIASHWKNCNIKFDSIYTGYLANKKQIDYVIDFISDFKKDSSPLIFADPAMADNGKLYAGFSDDFPKSMARLCSVADIAVPNITEACLMTDTEYKTEYDEKYIKDLLEKICSMGAKVAVLTGVSYEKSTQGAVIYDSISKKYFEYFAENIPASFHGTGDTFASVFFGCLTKGFDMEKSLRTAVDFTCECIKHTIPFANEHFYGTKFEECLPYLIKLTECDK